MKKMLVLILALSCLLVLSGCCFHSEWYAANCTTPKTCVKCGETEGEALGHTWVEADCTTPKTCSVCHLTEGEALGHTWVDATTEAPKTCTTCSATEGERIITDERFTTVSTIDLQGKWVASLPIPPEMFGVDGFGGSLDLQISIELGNDGTMTLGYTTLNEDEFIAALIAYTTDMLYAELANAGMSEEEADAAMVDTYGMNCREYAETAFADVNLAATFAAMNINGVYYVDGDQLYTGISWEEELGSSAFTLEGDTLTLEEEISGLSEESLVFSRVTE